MSARKSVNDLRINKERLMHHLESLAEIGALPGAGVCRLAFSKEDKQGRNYVEQLMKGLGLHVSIDAIGNIMGIRPGNHPTRVVLTGSHTDTVGTGGCYDGSLGVIAGLEVLQTIAEAGIETPCALGVVSFVNEEGVRFMPDMMGSMYVSGQLSLEEVRGSVGTDGVTAGACIDSLNFKGPGSIDSLDVGGFVELHIEQGPVLEKEGVDIGIVDRVQGILWQNIACSGATNHAGVTPMERRQDAGYVAAAINYQLRHMTERIAGLRATVGTTTFAPNLINVIPEKAHLTVDMRHPDRRTLEQAERELNAFIETVSQKERVVVSTHTLARVAPVAFSEDCISHIEKAVTHCGYSSRRMTSGAGHDAQVVASRWPAAMIFIPSQGGISHNVNEYSTPEHIEAGANTLLHTLLGLAA